MSSLMITRLFENANAIPENGIYGIWLCDHYQWKCYIIDDKIALNEEDQPIGTTFKGNSNQVWIYLLEKCFAISVGGYERLESFDVGTLFHMLTGSNVLGYRVREDPSKNTKLLKMVESCFGKNFLIHCEKS